MRISDAATIGEEPPGRASAHARVGHRYRPEIDGLRAIAVIGVILFHAGFDWIGGGYVGVDVFFVISGFLITSIVLREQEAGTFSLASFYERRARRILPALFAVMTACVLPAIVLMVPRELQGFGASVAATAAFASNALFLQTSGYFDVTAELKPLLHTWSLGIEEQFYLVFPLFLAFFRRWRTRLLIATALVAMLSLLRSIDLTASNPDAGFYLLAARAWELLAGSLLAMAKVPSAIARLDRRFREGLGWLGALALTIPMIYFDEATVFPGAAALIPVIGTALIIAAVDETSLLGRILALRPMLWIGAISYSAYLWHQPIFAFARLYRDGIGPTGWLFLSMASLAIAHLSWRFVEAPFRDRRNFTRAGILSGSFVVSLILFAAGSALFLTKGLPQRFDAPTLALVAPDRSIVESCPPYREGVYRCALGTPGGEPDIILLGDSHALAIADELSRALARKGRSGVLLQAPCHPIPGFRADDGGSASGVCERATRALMRIAVQEEGERIVLAVRWTMRLYPMGDAIDAPAFDNKEGGVERDLPYRRNIVRAGGSGETAAADAKRRALAAYIGELAEAKPVTLVYPVPEVGWQPTRRNLRALLDDRAPPETISTSFERFLDRNSAALETLDSIHGPGIDRVRPSDLFCDTVLPKRCIVQWRNHLYYYDDDHLSSAGARLVAERIMQAREAGPLRSSDRPSPGGLAT